ncbi:MAG: hypothetical protein DRG83_12785 [Deltaproteobacteria bacterium]|nr:MAG: hypothetical protein DRG83_12785 [Deltaproteobacteria bacterium]
MEKPVSKKKKGISPIWILPAIALCIGAWLLYKGIVERPVYIVVHFRGAEGVTAGKTKVMYKGLPVGVVEEITVDEGLDTVSMKIAIDPRAKKGLVKDLKFWIVRPEIAAGRVRGLQTLLSGSYIAVQPGRSKEPCREFYGLDEPPPVPEDAPGLHIKLRTEALNSLQQGSPIYYKDIRVGSVQGYTLEEDGTILVSAYIEPEYKRLVKPGSRFWNASGITLSGGLSGIKFHMESITTLINGGVSFYTPEFMMDQEPAKNGQVYKLYEDYEDAQYGIDVRLKIESGENIVEGLTKVIYRGLEVGRVKKVVLNKGQKRYKVTAHLLLDPMARPILKEGTKFWIIRPTFGAGGVKNLGTLVSGAYITFVPGEGKPCFDFVAEGSNSKEIFRDGKFYKLVSSDLQSLAPGTPILFKHIQVGEVARYELNREDNSVYLIFIIYDDYTHLINDKCVFWNYSGLELKVTPAGVTVNTDTLMSIVSGGIVFDYPKKYYGKELKTVEPGHQFKLYKNYSEAIKAVPELKPKGIFVKFESDEPLPIRAGSPICYKKVEIGQVTSVGLDAKKDKIVVNAFIKKKYLGLMNSSSRFYCTGGVEIEGSIRSGIKIKSSTLASVMMGTITFVNQEKGKPIKEWHVFKLYKDLDSATGAAYVSVDIRFPNIQPLEVNSKVRYKGIEIGYVDSVKIDDEAPGMIAHVKVKKKAASLFTTGSRVWVARAEFGLGGIRNLDTLITGPYIAMEKGPGEVTQTVFGMSSPPAVIEPDTGLNIVVEADTLGSLKKGSPVYYRQVKVGEVTGHELSPDSRMVWIHLNIREPYKNLVRANTRFWNASGIRVKAGIFSGVKIKTESFETIIAGGIAFATPEGDEMGGLVSNGRHFRLYDKPKDEWLEWQPVIYLRGKGRGQV